MPTAEAATLPCRLSELELKSNARLGFRGAECEVGTRVWAALYALSKNRGAIARVKLVAAAWPGKGDVTPRAVRSLLGRCNAALGRVGCPLVVSGSGPDVRMG